MGEETNLTGAEEASESLFEDVAEDTTESSESQDAETETVEDTTDAAEAEQNDNDNTGNEQTIKIKYNGEDLEIPMSEAVLLAQKGKNYDKLQDRYNALKNSEEMKLLASFAKQNGMTVEQYVKFSREQQQSQQVQTELNAIMEHDPDIDPTIAKELAESRAAKKAETFERQQRDDELKPWEDFVNAYPEMGTDVTKLPADVQEAISNGETPIHAMRAHELAQERKKREELERQLEAEKKNQKNKQASTGSAKSTGTTQKDPFLDGFLS